MVSLLIYLFVGLYLYLYVCQVELCLLNTHLLMIGGELTDIFSYDGFLYKGCVHVDVCLC